MNREVIVTQLNSHRRFEQHQDRGIDQTSIRMDVRRVVRNDTGTDEVQIEMTMSKHFPRTGRTTAQYGSFVMDSAAAAVFARAILELR